MDVIHIFLSHLPIARRLVHDHEGDEDAEKEEDEHGVLRKLDVLRVEAGGDAVATAERVVVVHEFRSGTEG